MRPDETAREEEDEGHEAPPHDRSAKEPLGPMTPDEETAAGDTPEAHDEITPHDLPPEHPGREAAAEQAGGGEGMTRGGGG